MGFSLGGETMFISIYSASWQAVLKKSWAVWTLRSENHRLRISLPNCGKRFSTCGSTPLGSARPFHRGRLRPPENTYFRWSWEPRHHSSIDIQAGLPTYMYLSWWHHCANPITYTPYKYRCMWQGWRHKVLMWTSHTCVETSYCVESSCCVESSSSEGKMTLHEF